MNSLTRLLVVISTLLLVACGSSSDSGPAGGNTGVQVFLTDAPAGDLDTFVLTISQVRLVTDTGGTVIASDGTVEQDLLNLVMIQKLIASEFIAPGVYTGLELDVDDITATANGNSLTISEPKPAVIVVRFEDPVTLLPDSQAMITLDFDVEDSVADDPSDPSTVNLTLN